MTLGRRELLARSVLAVLLVGFVAWRPAWVAGQALVLLPDLFPSAPIDPLAVFTPTPPVTEQDLAYSGGTIHTRVFHTAGRGRHGGVMLLLGVGELPREDLGVRFAQALARLGLVTMLPESSGLLAEHVNQAEVDGLSTGYDLLLAQPDVDPARTGVIGLSAAGGLAIVAAAEPTMRDRLRLVTSLGGYYDARSLLLDVSTRSMDVDGQVLGWSPDERTVEVVRQALFDAGADPDPVFAGRSRADAQAWIDALPEPVQARLAAISPSAHVADLRAHLYLLHDRDDSFIPFTETRALAQAAPPGLVQRYTEFSIFAHVIPDRPVPWQTFLPDLWALFWDVHAILLELL